MKRCDGVQWIHKSSRDDRVKDGCESIDESHQMAVGLAKCAPASYVRLGLQSVHHFMSPFLCPAAKVVTPSSFDLTCRLFRRPDQLDPGP